MGNMGILLVIYDGVYVCIGKLYYSVFKEYTQHAFIYASHFSPLDKIGCCGAIIDNISYAPIWVLEVKDIKSKISLKNMLRKFFKGTFIVEYNFKVTVNDLSSHIINIYYYYTGI